MTTPDQREHELQTLLRKEADRVDVPGDFAPVAIAKRRRDQRNRAVLGAAAAVAAIAVAVPTLWSVRGGPAPVPGLTTSTSVASATTSTSPPTSAPPATGAVATRANTYALDDTIRFGDKVIRLETGTVVENLAVVSNGGFVLMSHLSTPNAQSVLEILSPTGRTVRRIGASGGYDVSPAGTRVLAKSGTSSTLFVYAAVGSVVAQRREQR